MGDVFSTCPVQYPLTYILIKSLYYLGSTSYDVTYHFDDTLKPYKNNYLTLLTNTSGIIYTQVYFK